ncbi:hypothetical protein C8R44DRAFT_984913 [Mycena epipterygia]|nr:hypothetical protein C8R44DRAFT_984913 [Mycena epipterygia]
MLRRVRFEDQLEMQTSALQLTEQPELQQLETYTDPGLALPPEIVSEIFVQFLPRYPEHPPLLGIFSPLLLCRICRQWRQIALSTPNLWRAIDMDLKERHKDSELSWKHDLMDSWLSRSGDCPLSITLVYHAGTSLPPPPPSLSEFLRTIVRHCKCWEYIRLQMPFEYSHLIQGDMPLLRRLSVGPSELPADEETPVILFEHAPLLTHVILADSFVPSLMRLPWAQLTRVEGLCLYARECTEILTYANHLVHCTFHVCGPPELNNLAILAAPAHAHLRDLVLLPRLSCDEDCTTILENVTLPALRTLQIPESCIAAGTVDSLREFVARSKCALKDFRVQGSSLPDSAYHEALPSIKATRIL